MVFKPVNSQVPCEFAGEYEPSTELIADVANVFAGGGHDLLAQSGCLSFGGTKDPCGGWSLVVGSVRPHTWTYRAIGELSLLIFAEALCHNVPMWKVAKEQLHERIRNSLPDVSDDDILYGMYIYLPNPSKKHVGSPLVHVILCQKALLVAAQLSPAGGAASG